MHRAVQALAAGLRRHHVPIAEWPGLPSSAGIAGIWRQARRLRAALGKGGEGIAVSFTPADHLALTWAGRGLRTHLLLWQAEPSEWDTSTAASRFWRLLPLLARRNVTLAAPNAALTKMLAQGARISPGDIAHLPLPAPWPMPEPDVPADLPDLSTRPPVILFPAPLERAMQPGMAMRAFGLMADEDARLVLPATGALLGAMRHMVAHLGLGTRVIFAPPAEIDHGFARARLCCLPPRMDALALEAVRALMHGLPVIGTRLPALCEIIGNDAALGALVEITDIEGLGRALATYLHHPGPPAPRLRRARDFHPERVAAIWKRALLSRHQFPS